jgi:hypothetical protein
VCMRRLRPARRRSGFRLSRSGSSSTSWVSSNTTHHAKHVAHLPLSPQLVSRNRSPFSIVNNQNDLSPSCPRSLSPRTTAPPAAPTPPPLPPPRPTPPAALLLIKITMLRAPLLFLPAIHPGSQPSRSSIVSSSSTSTRAIHARLSSPPIASCIDSRSHFTTRSILTTHCCMLWWRWRLSCTGRESWRGKCQRRGTRLSGMRQGRGTWRTRDQYIVISFSIRSR